MRAREAVRVAMNSIICACKHPLKDHHIEGGDMRELSGRGDEAYCVWSMCWCRDFDTVALATCVDADTQVEVYA